MGGQLSNLFGKKEEDDDQIDLNLREYQRKMDAGDTFVGAEQDKKKVAWWEHLLFDKRSRIVYVTILAVVLGIVIPAVIFATTLQSEAKQIYGSCLIKDYARFECLFNSEKPATEESCANALCCWDSSASDLSFKCYHSFPSAYQYTVSSSNTYTEKSHASTKNGEPKILTWTDLKMRASREGMMPPIRLLTHWESEAHLVMEIFNSQVFPDRKPKGRLTKGSTKNSVSAADDENMPFDISWGEKDNLFFIRIARRDTNETIFDTRLGPVYATTKDITLATVLPTKYFYGMKGGQGSVSTLTYGVVNGFENSEFPFYISFEASGKWHGVLIDTTEPILAQVVQAPGILLHLETDRPEINLHFFVGPTQPLILKQLHEYIRDKHQITHPPMIPPYWGLGMHLCRRLQSGSEVLEHIDELFKGKQVVYDSDCIDEYLRHPIFLNETHFAPNLTDILDRLSEKRILLSQKATVLVSPVEDSTEESGQGNTISNDDNQSYFKNKLVLETRNNSNKPFLGQIGDVTVNYIDFFNAHFLANQFPPVPLQGNASDPEAAEILSLPHHGFSLDDNIPKLDLTSEHCSAPKTRLQSYFTSRLQTTSDNSLNTTYLWGSLCPLDTKHNNLPNTTEGVVNGTKSLSHFRLHNLYGEQSLKIVYRTLMERQEEKAEELKALLTSGSFWTSSLYYGAYNGMQVPFTWKGLQESVKNTVRNYALAPISGTPICGGMLANNVTFARNNDLCLRWFQFGLLLPFARNSYDGVSSYGPFHFTGQFRVYLNETIKTRYTYSPYYYTELLKYQQTYVPLIRPMSFDFSGWYDRNETLPLLDQFMVGDAMFAAPIIDRGERRFAYFPAGAWYAMDGTEVKSTGGTTRSITGLITETPLFLRGGYMIPTLQNPQHDSIEETLQGSYSLIAALSTELRRTAKGYLTVKEPNSNVAHFVDFVTLVNTTEDGKFLMTVTINGTCGSPDPAIVSTYTKIDQIRVLGLPYMGRMTVTVKNSNGETSSGTASHYNENKQLRISKLGMNWCTSTEYEVRVMLENDQQTTPDGGSNTGTTEMNESTGTTESPDSSSTTEGNDSPPGTTEISE